MTGDQCIFYFASVVEFCSFYGTFWLRS